NLAPLTGLGIRRATGLEALQRATLVVDGVFGTGLTRDVEGSFARALRAMDGARAPLVALDLPSGVDADTGQVRGIAPRAALTCTFAAMKPGLAQHPGRGLAGEVVVVALGVPGPRAGRRGIVEEVDVARWLPPRSGDAHKGRAGHLLVLGGVAETSGAARLSARGALRAGAGRVTLGRRGPAAPSALPELMSAATPTLDAAREALQRMQAGVLGPGFGLDEAGRALALALARDAELPLVLDADALTALADAGGLEALRGAAPRVLTPHPGEASRLLGVPTAEVQADRHGAARELARRSVQVVALKGAGTVVAGPEGDEHVVLRGTPALAVAGSGDVLAGVVGACLAQGLDPLEATSAAVWLHAAAGERAAEGADRGILAGEVADALPRVLAGLDAARDHAARR
ncbi:MAG: NAD(P)H-hydrate dehydratase, partial [Myxococcota bacterium]